jgi:xanthine dehydrogenase accessory factor
MRQQILDQLLRDKADKRPVVLATMLSTAEDALFYPGEPGPFAFAGSDLTADIGAAVREDKARTVETSAGDVFLNVFNPPLRMAIVGAVHIAYPLVAIARIAGYDVTVIDPRRAFATDTRFPETDLVTDWPDEAMDAFRPDARSAIVTLTHDPKLDDPALERALRTDAFYIGCLGSKKTHAARLERLRRMGFGDDVLARIHGPVGLKIGARSPAEIAVAIMAQITEVLRRAPEDASET